MYKYMCRNMVSITKFIIVFTIHHVQLEYN